MRSRRRCANASMTSAGGLPSWLWRASRTGRRPSRWSGPPPCDGCSSAGRPSRQGSANHDGAVSTALRLHAGQGLQSHAEDRCGRAGGRRRGAGRAGG
eukprot:9170164-Alexandrium_andersonii.AAC.1